MESQDMQDMLHCSTAVSFALKSEVDNVEDVGAQKVQDRKQSYQSLPK